MTTIYTAAKRMKLLRVTAPSRIRLYPIPSRELNLVDQLVVDLASAKHRRFNMEWIDGLQYVHLQISLVEMEMPKPKRNRSFDRGDMPEMIGFKLDIEELIQFDAWVKQKDFNYRAMLEETLLSGVKVGVSWDAYNDCFIASFTPKDDEHPNKGLCLLSRSSDWEEAIALNLFKASVVFSGKSWATRKDDNQRG